MIQKSCLKKIFHTKLFNFYFHDNYLLLLSPSLFSIIKKKFWALYSLEKKKKFVLMLQTRP